MLYDVTVIKNELVDYLKNALGANVSRIDLIDKDGEGRWYAPEFRIRLYDVFGDVKAEKIDFMGYSNPAEDFECIEDDEQWECTHLYLAIVSEEGVAGDHLVDHPLNTSDEIVARAYLKIRQFFQEQEGSEGLIVSDKLDAPD